MAKRRLKNADEAMMGPKPSYGVHNPVPTNKKDKDREYRRARYWFYYFENKKKATETVLTYCTRVLNFDKTKIANLKKLPDWKYRMKTYQTIELINNGWTGYPLTDEAIEEMHTFLKGREKEGRAIQKVEDKKPKPIVISPAERIRRKVMQTM